VEKEEDLTILINLDLVNDADGNDVMDNDNDDNVDQVHYIPKQLSASQFYKNAESTLKSVRNEWTSDNIGYNSMCSNEKANLT